MDSTIYSEVLVRCSVLIRNVLRDHFVCHVAGTTAEISSRPLVPSPKLLLQVRKLCQQVMRGSPFQPLHQAADCHLRRQRDQQMHVVLRYVPFMIQTSCCPLMSRIRSRTLVAISPVSAGRRYFVIHTKCSWISNTVCAPRRYSIPEVYPARTR